MNKRHIWIMLLGCLLPILGLAAVLLLKVPISRLCGAGIALPAGSFFHDGQHAQSQQPAGPASRSFRP